MGAAEVFFFGEGLSAEEGIDNCLVVFLNLGIVGAKTEKVGVVVGAGDLSILYIKTANSADAFETIGLDAHAMASTADEDTKVFGVVGA